MLFPLLLTLITFFSTIPSSSEYDYVIVGGGSAGLSQAAFLSRVSPDSSILLIEKTGRIGGRVFTTYFKHDGKQIHFENNAMRFGWNGYLYRTLNYLGLCNESESMLSNGRNRTVFFRNLFRPRPTGSLNDLYFAFVYNWTENDKAIFTGGSEALQNKLRDEFRATYNYTPNEATPEEWLECMTEYQLDGLNPIDINWLSHDFYLMNGSVEWYFARKHNQYPPFFDASLGTRFCGGIPIQADLYPSRPSDVTGGQKTLKIGYGAVTDGLFEKCLDNPNFDYLLNTEVTGIEKKGSRYSIKVRNRYDWSQNNDEDEDENDEEEGRRRSRRLLDNDEDEEENEEEEEEEEEEEDDDDDEYGTIYAENVILAIPPMSLKTLYARIEPFRHNKYVWELVDSVSKVEPGYRVNFIYNSEDLKTLDLTNYVQSITDNSLRSIYVQTSWTNDTLFAIQFYSRVEQATWLDMMQQVGEPYDSGADFELDPVSESEILYSSRVVVERLRDELATLLNYPQLEMPIASFSTPLGVNESHYDGLYVFKSGYNNRIVIPQIRHPIPDETIYVASGAYSKWCCDIYGAISAAYDLTVEVLNFTDPLEGYENCVF